MAAPGQELASLDFANLIGGPLNAVIEAQAKSAITTADFIKTVGFNADGEVIATDFSYTKETAEGGVGKFTMSVPFLIMLPIPYIRIDEATIEFNANITSTTSASTSSDFGMDTQTSVDGSAGFAWWRAKASFKAQTSYKKATESSSNVEKTYSMKIMIRAKQADMPAGTERILSILENVMSETQVQPEALGDSITVSSITGNTVTLSTEPDAGAKFIKITGAVPELAEIKLVDTTNKTVTANAEWTTSPTPSSAVELYKYRPVV